MSNSFVNLSFYSNAVTLTKNGTSKSRTSRRKRPNYNYNKKLEKKTTNSNLFETSQRYILKKVKYFDKINKFCDF